tara:strand:- start:407 stop:916 length:510 start_codon:yes stop_codon:yes gene_type:complete
MEFRNNLTGEVVSRNELLKNLGNPKPSTVANLESYGYTKVFDGALPKVTSVYDTIERDGIRKDAKGDWYTNYRIGPIFVDTKDDSGNVIATAAQNEAAYRKNIDDTKADNVRETRNQKLKDSDWTQIADTALTDTKKAEWVTYRKALRDLPATSGSNWPHKVTFPTEPT